jgi:two-component system, sensor histidine kinase
VRPITELAAAAAKLGSGQSLPPTTTAIVEVTQMARSFQEADVAISERDRALVTQGEALTAQADALQKADANRTKLLALIGHELRNPLSTLKVSLALAHMPGVDPQARARAFELMERNVAMLERLVGDLNDVGRAGRGELEMRIKPVALDQVILSSVEAVRADFQAKQQTLNLQLAATTVMVDADAERLEQVFVNLLTNAQRYGREGGHVHVETIAEVGRAIVKVSDDGIGFAAGDSASLFNMFARLGDASTRPAASLGIGLSICRAIVELHGGSITASSEGLQKGATFTVTLPLQQSDTAADDDVASVLRLKEAPKPPALG